MWGVTRYERSRERRRTRKRPARGLVRPQGRLFGFEFLERHSRLGEDAEERSRGAVFGMHRNDDGPAALRGFADVDFVGPLLPLEDEPRHAEPPDDLLRSV